MDYQLRLNIAQKKLRRRKIDILLVASPENRRYLSGYSAVDHGIAESSGILFIPARGQARLLTDFRYQLQAECETDLEVVVYRKGLISLLESLLSAEKDVQRLAFESHYTLHSFSLKLAALAEKRKVTLVPVTALIEKLRVIKSQEEIELLRRSVSLNERVFRSIHRSLMPEMTELDIALAVESAMLQAGAEAPSFLTIVAAGDNSASPHAAPTRQAVGSNRSITLDMGLKLKGYCSDMTRNFVIGEPDSRYFEIHRLVRKAQKAGIGAVRAGITAAQVDRAARKIIADAGYSKHFGHALGHGVGLAVHEEPRVSARSRKQLKAGMVVTIEPGIYLPGWGGVRLENMVVVGDDGCEVLNRDETWLDI
ncbi:MAG: aminopeptidase P family protein [Desulfobacterales bacterium]|nr:aminopeptidase P family protein [Desulfobacterales bacterium]